MTLPFNPKASNMKIVPLADVGYVGEILFNRDGTCRPVNADDLKDVPQEHLMQFCVKNAIYQIPTLELIRWLQEKIDGRQVIEIGSGKAGIGRAMGMPCTDSYSQVTEEMRILYKSMGQAVVEPPEYVEKLDAIEAIKKYKPEVVIGCFITHKYRDGMESGNMFGPEEEEIVKRATYIHVGNLNTHREKPILQLPHEEYSFPWLRSRAFDQSLNRIWEWKQ